MPLKSLVQVVATSIMLVTLFAAAIPSFAESIHYIYDDLNRLTQVQYNDGTIIEYTYDEIGNRLQKTVNDITPPLSAASPAGGSYASTQTVSLTCDDGLGIGCDKIFYTTNGTTPSTSSSIYAAPLTIAATTTIKYFSTDLAGNQESVKSQIYTIDTALPTGTMTINSGAAYTATRNVTLALTCSDNIGCVQMQFSNDNISWSDPEGFTSSKAWAVAEGDGAKTVYVKFRDAAGNWSTVTSEGINLDGTSPATIASPVGGTYTRRLLPLM